MKKNIFKITTITFLLLSVVLGIITISALSKLKVNNIADRDEFYFHAEIINVNENNIHVKGLDCNDINFRSEFTFNITEETSIEWRYTDIKKDDLYNGQRILIVGSGPIMQSYPAQLTNVSLIQLLDDSLDVNNIIE